jgi:hypothetical protein
VNSDTGPRNANDPHCERIIVQKVRYFPIIVNFG